MARKLLFPAALLFFALPIAFAQMPAAVSAATTTDVSAPLSVGGDVLPPVLIRSVEPKFKRPIFHKPKDGIVLVGVTVPVDGVPTGIHIVKSGGKTFDKSALTAIGQYRFRPATQHGKPVAVAINIEVQYRVY